MLLNHTGNLLLSVAKRFFRCSHIRHHRLDRVGKDIVVDLRIENFEAFRKRGLKSKHAKQWIRLLFGHQIFAARGPVGFFVISLQAVGTGQELDESPGFFGPVGSAGSQLNKHPT